LTQYWLQGHVS